MKKKHIPIFTVASDERILELVVSLSSISQYSSDDNIYDVRVLHGGMSMQNVRRLRHLRFKNVEVFVTDMTELISTCTNARLGRTPDVNALVEFYKFFIPCMYPRIQRALYIDNDVVLRDDIARLLDTPMGDAIIAAPRSDKVADEEVAEYVRARLGISPEEYADSGILVINMREYRSARVLDSLYERVSAGGDGLLSAADDFVSVTCRGRIAWLDPAWSAQSYSEEEIKSPRLVHYNNYKKPKYYLDSPYSEVFWMAASRTAFFNDIMSECMRYGEAQRSADELARERYIRRARALATV